ncbi:hypothetical protein B0F90DRAFT_1815996 [Multifurca ochricompacta]|uniref:Uncharacterized protein n=1 Tax=Multifurca ochricompacta TaxID=376703 RepID=A0AAD4M8Q5_9AGAM|nr:hypothetical protein B0F90DRAFT_1815996 [Multifurca ochricompacta]
MFKRVDRRLKRKEEEERLGLDDDEREVLGLHHTDSSESESDSPSSSSASTSSSLEQTSTGHGAPSVNKRKRRASSHSRSENEEDEELGSDHEIDSPLTVASALNEPVQLIRSYPEAWVCVFCPNKILKHAAMIHQHRFKRIQELASGFSPHEDIRTLLLKSTVESQPPLSRRAEQKKYRQVKLKERRNRVKEKKAAAMPPRT